MSVEIDEFSVASERLELWLNSIALVAQGQSMDTTMEILSVTSDEYLRFGNLLESALHLIATISDGSVKWEHGRGLSGLVLIPSATFPHCWSSAHEAVLRITKIGLERFYSCFDEVDGEAKRKSLFKEVFAKVRRDAIAMGIEEVAELQERIRRERAKFVHLIEQQQTQGDPLTSLEVKTRPKQRRKPTSRNAVRDQRLFALANEGHGMKEIMAIWNRENPRDNLSYDAVKKAIQRYRDNQGHVP